MSLESVNGVQLLLSSWGRPIYIAIRLFDDEILQLAVLIITMLYSHNHNLFTAGLGLKA